MSKRGAESEAVEKVSKPRHSEDGVAGGDGWTQDVSNSLKKANDRARKFLDDGPEAATVENLTEVKVASIILDYDMGICL